MLLVHRHRATIYNELFAPKPYVVFPLLTFCMFSKMVIVFWFVSFVQGVEFYNLISQIAILYLYILATLCSSVRIRQILTPSDVSLIETIYMRQTQACMLLLLMILYEYRFCLFFLLIVTIQTKVIVFSVLISIELLSLQYLLI